VALALASGKVYTFLCPEVIQGKVKLKICGVLYATFNFSLDFPLNNFGA